MPTLTIRQQRDFDVTLSIDQAGDYPVTVSDPFSPEEEKRLEWYFEEHLRFPFIDGKKAEAAAASVTEYGERLFEQLFSDRHAFSEYKDAIRSGLDNLTIEIIGQPDFHRLHWEALKDPDLPDPFAIHANIVRRRPTPQTLRAPLTPSPTINVLVVTARPGGSADVGYRTISRPLIETLGQTTLRLNIDLLRPGTYLALVRQLEAKPVGYYHVIHFDVHGALLDYGQLERAIQQDRIFFRTRYGRDEFKQYDGTRGYLALEGEKEGQPDFVEAGELAKLLITRQTPIVILNACQSGKQVGDSETSLGARLMEAGVQTVLAMSYSVTVSAAEQLMVVLYRQLFDSQPLATSIRRARAELHRQKQRRGYYSQRVALEDWLLPVVYSVGESHTRSLRVSEDTEAVKAWWQRKAEIDAYRQSRRQPTYGFFGRDIDILTIERRLLAGDFVESNTGGSQPSNVLLIQGMGGAGKSTLIHHLADWWRTTHLVERVFYFGYDEKAWTLQQILHELARQLLDPTTLNSLFLPANLAVQQAMIVQQLRSQRHLLLLDNLESITGSPLAIPNTLPAAEQQRLADFVAALHGGRTLLLLGSRAAEAWLVQRLGNPVYELGGLDPEAASALSDAILQRTLTPQRAEEQRKDPNLVRLLRLLAGYPLALEVVLPNLAQQSVAAVLQALEEGDIALDSASAENAEFGMRNADSDSFRIANSELRTRSILRCIDYSHSNLDPEAQELLLALAPFSGVINPDLLPQYIEQLRQQPPLAHLPWQRLPAVVEQAKGWGLLAAHPQVPTFLQPQPILPWFLRNRLASLPEPVEGSKGVLRTAIESAFRQHYDGIARALVQMMQSKEPQQRQLGQALTALEYENLFTCLNLALAAQLSILNPYYALSLHADATQNQQQGLLLGEMTLAKLQQYAVEVLAGAVGAEFVGVIDNIAKRQLLQKKYAAAEASYQLVLSRLKQNPSLDQKLTGSVYHQLGMVAEEQRQWQQAEAYYKQALQIKIDFNDRYTQASTYHQLGIVAEEQRQWQQAEAYYKQALQLKIDFNDRYSQAGTYHNLGVVAQEQRQWQQAEAYYKQALQIYIDFNDRYSQAKTLHTLGSTKLGQKEYDEADHYYGQALALYIEFGDRFWEAGAYHNLGVVAEEQRQWQQAEAYYKQALQIYIDFNDRYSQASTYVGLGAAAHNQEQWQQAKEYYLTALQTYLEYQDQHNAQLVIRNLAILWQASDDGSLLAAVAGLLGASVAEAEALLRQATAD